MKAAYQIDKKPWIKITMKLKAPLGSMVKWNAPVAAIQRWRVRTTRCLCRSVSLSVIHLPLEPTSNQIQIPKSVLKFWHFVQNWQPYLSFISTPEPYTPPVTGSSPVNNSSLLSWRRTFHETIDLASQADELTKTYQNIRNSEYLQVIDKQ